MSEAHSKISGLTQRALDWRVRAAFFRQFAWLEVGSRKAAFSRPAHPRVTHPVGLPLADIIRSKNKEKTRMRLPGHIAGAWLASKFVIDRLDIDSSQERNNLSLFSAVVGTIPDWDYLLYIVRKKGIKYESDFRHHTWITHTFPFYWIISGLIYLFGILQKKPLLKKQAAVFAVATSTHLTQDMAGSGDGIMALYPLSKRMYGVGLSGLHGKEWNDNYVKSPYYLIEIALVIAACITFILSLFQKRK